MLQTTLNNAVTQLLPDASELPVADKLFILSNCLKLLQRFAHDCQTLTAIGELFDACAQRRFLVDLAKVPADVAQLSVPEQLAGLQQEGLSETEAEMALWVAYRLYIELLSAAEPTEDFTTPFASALEVSKEEWRSQSAPPAAPMPAAPAAPLLVSDSLIRQIFKVKPLGRDFINFMNRMGCSLVLYRHQAVAPEVRGWAFSLSDGAKFLLLETGEALSVAPSDLPPGAELTFLSDKQDYAAVSATLLCLLYVASEELLAHGIIDADAQHIIAAGFFGELLVPQENCPPQELLSALEQYMLAGDDSALSDAAVVFSAAVPNTDISIWLQLKPAAHGPSVFSFAMKEIAGTPTVVMRNDTPRQIGLFGLYLFPFPDRLICLFLVPHE